MKKFFVLVMLIIFASLQGCGRPEEVSGRSLRTANKSVIYIKRHLPPEQQVEFEVAFWTIRSNTKTEKELLDKVGGKKPEEIIAMAKSIFQEKKTAGFKDYQQFGSWEQMIAKFSQERIEQNKHGKKADPRDEKNNVLYKL